MIDINVIEMIDEMKAIAEKLLQELEEAEKENRKLKNKIEILENSLDDNYFMIETLKSQNERYERIIKKIKKEITI